MGRKTSTKQHAHHHIETPDVRLKPNGRKPLLDFLHRYYSINKNIYFTYDNLATTNVQAITL